MISKTCAVYSVGVGRHLFLNFCLMVIDMVKQILETTPSQHQIFPRASSVRFAMLLHE
jgi:hypothetical protein